MDFLDLEVNKEVYVFNKVEKSIVKAFVLSVADYVESDLGKKTIGHDIYRRVELLIYESAGRYVPGYGISDRGKPVTVVINNHDKSCYFPFNLECENYDFYNSFEEFKKNIDGIVKDFETTRINSLQRTFEQDKKEIEKKATELKAELLKIGEENGKFKRK